MKNQSLLNLLTARRTVGGAALLALCATLPVLADHQLTTVWEHLINKPGNPLPVLTNTVNYTTDDDNGDGKTKMDSLAGLRRYDANRLLLGVRENGVDETATDLTPEQQALAAAYPDRSLIWINPTNGAPLGLALTIGLYPVTLDPDFLAAGATTNQYWWSFDVSADGYVYTGYKNKILRYAPNGLGGLNPTPTVVFTLPEGNAVPDTSFWPNWRWAKLRVMGTGTSTVLLAGGNGGRGYIRLSTTDGNTFVDGSWMQGGFGNGGSGGASHLIPDPNGGGAEWAYSSSYPGSSSGADTSFYRFAAVPPFGFTENFTKDGTFSAGSDTNDVPADTKYMALFIGDVDVNADAGYVVAYSTPSWNSTASIGATNPRRPGWLALHTLDGKFLSAHKIDVRESDELLSADDAALFQGAIGYVTINKLPNGTLEVLWSGSIYGYGRYAIGGAPMTNPEPAKITKATYEAGVFTVEFTGNGSTFQLLRRTQVGSGEWQPVGESTSNKTISDNAPPPGAAFYRIQTLN